MSAARPATRRGTTGTARAAGATQVITVGRGKRLVTARELGSTEVVDYSAADPVAAGRSFVRTSARGLEAPVSGTPEWQILSAAFTRS